MNFLDSFFAFINKQADVTGIRRGDAYSIFFDKDRLHYYFYHDASSDPYFFRIMLPRIEDVTEQNHSVIYDKCTTISTDFKVGKAIIIQGQVWLSVEVFVYDNTENVSLLFDRMISVLQLMFEKYKNQNNPNNNQ